MKVVPSQLSCLQLGREMRSQHRGQSRCAVNVKFQDQGASGRLLGDWGVWAPLDFTFPSV